MKPFISGGGTPSLIPPDDLEEIIGALQVRLPFLATREVTLEANPDSIALRLPEAWRSVGINRISLGIQSFSDKELSGIGRSHSAERGLDAYAAIRQAGFSNVSCDMIIGLPNQSRKVWHYNLSRLLELSPEHISLYLLEVHGDSPLYQWISEKRVQLPPEKRVIVMYQDALALLQAAGYEHYEISNFAKSGFPSRHNCKYWKSEPVLGFGAGSYSAIGQWRFQNHDGIHSYLTALERTGSGCMGSSMVDQATWMGEFAISALRLRKGIHLKDFQRFYGFPFEGQFKEAIRHFEEMGLMERKDGYLRLKDQAILVSNEILEQFLVPEGNSEKQ